MELEKIIEKCIESAIDYSVSAFEVVVNAKKTNKFYDRQYNNFRHLKKHPHGVESLFQLLEHPNMYVRYTAAIHLLSVDEKKAKDVIVSVANSSGNGMLEFNTHYLLEEWDNGNIKDYYR